MFLKWNSFWGACSGKLVGLPLILCYENRKKNVCNIMQKPCFWFNCSYERRIRSISFTYWIQLPDCEKQNWKNSVNIHGSKKLSFIVLKVVDNSRQALFSTIILIMLFNIIASLIKFIHKRHTKVICLYNFQKSISEALTHSYTQN